MAAVGEAGDRQRKSPSKLLENLEKAGYKRKRSHSIDNGRLGSLKMRLRALDSINTRQSSHHNYVIVDKTRACENDTARHSEFEDSGKDPVTDYDNQNTLTAVTHKLPSNKTTTSCEKTATATVSKPQLDPMHLTVTGTDSELFIDNHFNKHCVGCDPEHMNCESIKTLVCESCVKTYCTDCVNVSDEQHKFLTSYSLCHWYCPPCERRVTRNLRVEAEVEERCQIFMNKMESRLEGLEMQMLKKPDRDEMVDYVDTEMRSQVALHIAAQDLVSQDRVQNLVRETNRDLVKEAVRLELSTVSSTAVSEDKLKELVELEVSRALESAESREERRRNIIIHNFPEAPSSEDCEVHDTEAVKTMINQHLEVRCKTPVKIARLGNQHRNRKRPIKICMNSEPDKIAVLTNSNKLRTALEPYKSARVSSDMSEAERNENKRLLGEARKRNDQESGNFIHLVRGPPWNRRIVTVPKRDT